MTITIPPIFIDYEKYDSGKPYLDWLRFMSNEFPGKERAKLIPTAALKIANHTLGNLIEQAQKAGVEDLHGGEIRLERKEDHSKAHLDLIVPYSFATYRQETPFAIKKEAFESFPGTEQDYWFAFANAVSDIIRKAPWSQDANFMRWWL